MSEPHVVFEAHSARCLRPAVCCCGKAVNCLLPTGLFVLIQPGSSPPDQSLPFPMQISSIAEASAMGSLWASYR